MAYRAVRMRELPMANSRGKAKSGVVVPTGHQETK